jgi:predicted RNase H-like HicB family nuclease
MTYRLPVLITKEEDFYVARCPELGVTSQGNDFESARGNLYEAIELVSGNLARNSNVIPSLIAPKQTP